MPPQAEKLNGRACMVGYFLALGVEKLTGAGLAEQQGSFLGLLSLHLVVFAVLLVPSMDRIQVRRDSAIPPQRRGPPLGNPHRCRLWRTIVTHHMAVGHALPGL